MATTITNNLYPPYIDSYMPAFDYTQDCYVYFSIPDVIDRNDLNGYVQLSLVDSQTNANQLNLSQYPGGIKRTTWSIDETSDDDDKYFIKIEPSDLIGTTINFNYRAAKDSSSYKFNVLHDTIYNDNPQYNKDGSVSMTVKFPSTNSIFNNTRMYLSKDGVEIGYFYLEDNQWNFVNTTTSDKVLYYDNVGISLTNTTNITLTFNSMNSGDYTFTTYFDYSTNNTELNHLCYIEDNTIKKSVSKTFSILDDDLNRTDVPVFSANELTLYSLDTISQDIDASYNEKFRADGYYRLQMRFEHTDTANPPRTGVTSKWLTKNRDYFSEWSTVCILRAIVPPTLVLDDFKTAYSVYKDILIHINNKVSFINNITNDETLDEYVTKYRVRLTKRASELYNSGWIIPTVTNQIIDEVEYMLSNTDDNKWYYVLKVDIITNNLYTKTFEYPFYTYITTEEPTIKLFYAKIDNDNGGVKLHFETTHDSDSWNKYYIIRRADDTSDFKLWNIIKKIYVPVNHVYTYTCYDYTTEVGTFYKYQIQTCDASETTYSSFYTGVGLYDDGSAYSTVMPHPSTVIGEDEDSITLVFNAINNIEDDTFVDSIVGNEDSTDFYISNSISSSSSSTSDDSDEDEERTMIMPYLDDIFLTDGNHCLCIKYDPDLGSIAYNRNESVTQTIGSKYPFITRSGLSEYKTFNLSGTIAAEMDENNIFTSSAKIYGNYAINHNTFNKVKGINTRYDYIYERKFREKVMSFLTDGRVKLYKSTQEGNMLIRLTDISITPKTEIGRLVYSFSATATEVDNCEIDNYNKYNIQKTNVKLKTIQVFSLDKYYEESESLYLWNNFFSVIPDSGYYKIKESATSIESIVDSDETIVYDEEKDIYLLNIKQDYNVVDNGYAITGYEVLVEED